jgi:hypothetical protein
MQTADIIDQTAATPLHLCPAANLDNAWVSSRSHWRDDRWILDNPTPGSTPIYVNWAIVLHDGSRLTEPHYAESLSWLQRFVWSLLVVSDKGQPLKPGTISSLYAGIATLVSWMVEHGYRKPCELDEMALETYKGELPSLLIDENDSETERNFDVFYNHLRVPQFLWQQRRTLAKAGIAPMPREPFAGKSAFDQAKAIATEARGWIKPLPDEIAIPVLNKAAWFLAIPADDILRLQADCLAAWQSENDIHIKGSGRSSSPKTRWQQQAGKTFQFSSLLGDGGSSWHASLRLEYGEDNESRVIQKVRRLVLALRTAAIIIIQAAGGMRISEICGLPAGSDQATGLPSCVRIERSATGLNELFIVRTVLSKTEATPRNVDWVIGMRPYGSIEVPLPVRALKILDQLLAPYRSLLVSNHLIVSFASATGLPKTTRGVGPIAAGHLNRSLQDWVVKWVDLSHLPDESAHKIEDKDLVPWRESQGRIITTHQFRKMWANFALAVDPRLLPVVQMHFHHLSQAMTEGGYWGRNLLQVAPLSTAKAQQTALFMYEMATGKSLVAGRMGEHVEEHIGQLRDRVKGKSTADGWKEAVQFSNEYDLRLWFAPHGKCLPLIPLSMRCHDVAGTISWLNKEPNYATRDPSICAGCSCFILDARHMGFWEDRFRQNWLRWQQAELMGFAEQFRVIRERAYQAKALLMRIGVDVNELELQVETQILEDDNAT